MTCLSEITELIEGKVEAEKVGEVACNGAQSWRLKDVIGHTQVDQRCQRCPERLNRVNEVARKVELAKIRWQVLDSHDLIVSQVKNRQVFKTQQLRIHALNVVLLRVEGLEEFE